MLAKSLWSLWSLWNLWSLYGDVRRFNTTLPLSLFFFLRSLFGHCLALFVVCFYLWVIVLSSSRIVPSCLLVVVIMARRFLWGASAWPPGPYACCFGWGLSSEAGIWLQRRENAAVPTLRFQVRATSGSTDNMLHHDAYERVWVW